MATVIGDVYFRNKNADDSNFKIDPSEIGCN